MKKGLFIIVLAIMVIGFVSCEKPQKEKDYREKWIGSYDCEKYSDKPCTIDVTIVLESDSLLHITERDVELYNMHQVKHDFKVNGDGRLSKIDNEYKPSITGNIYSDNIFLKLTVATPGMTSSTYYTGKKLKNVKQ